MSTKTLYGELLSNRPLEEIRKAVRKSFQIVEGVMGDTENGILILNGTKGVKNTFTTMKFHSTVDIEPVSEGKYNLKCTINWVPHWFHIAMLVWGFFTLVTWVYNVLYFFVDPIVIYQRALDRVEFYLE